MAKKGVVIPLGASGESDDANSVSSGLLHKDGYFWCYYSGYDGANWRICLAISKDGISFVKKGVVIPLGASGESDDTYTFDPSIIYKDGYFWCYYSGYDASSHRACLAVSKDGISFA